MSDLAERLRTAAKRNREARWESEIDPSEDLMDEIADEIERLQAELTDANRRVEWLAGLLGTITDRAKWCGLRCETVTINVTLWDLPNCDGRNGDLLKAAEKARDE